VSDAWLDEIRFNTDDLVPAITQDAHSGKVVYWSRSRGKLWHKGEESGHTQNIVDNRFDCDEDVILLKVEQIGGIACHTGRESCFYR